MQRQVNVLLVEPLAAGSHAAWIAGLVKHSRHSYRLLTRSGDDNWKWRMRACAASLAKQCVAEAAVSPPPDVVLATDMLDLSMFLALTRRVIAPGTPTVLYMHENQVTYPWEQKDRDRVAKRDVAFGLINWHSALAADHVWFNSGFHQRSFLDGLRKTLRGHRGQSEEYTVDEIAARSRTMHLGLDLSRFNHVCTVPAAPAVPGAPPIILWNHRWDYDKNPQGFFDVLARIDDMGIPFRLILLGANQRQNPSEFLAAKQRYGDRVIHYGYAESFQQYAQLVCSSDILPVTSNQDFFGISVVEAVYCGVYPLLPERLAYPEVVPASAAGDCVIYYRDNDMLVSLLARLLQADASQRQVPAALRHAVAAYDWEACVQTYDDALEQVMQQQQDARTETR